MSRNPDHPFECSCGRSFSSYASLEFHHDEEHAPDLCRRCRREPVYQEGLCYPCSYYGH